VLRAPQYVNPALLPAHWRNVSSVEWCVWGTGPKTVRQTATIPRPVVATESSFSPPAQAQGAPDPARPLSELTYEAEYEPDEKAAAAKPSEDIEDDQIYQPVDEPDPSYTPAAGGPTPTDDVEYMSPEEHEEDNDVASSSSSEAMYQNKYQDLALPALPE